MKEIDLISRNSKLYKVDLTKEKNVVITNHENIFFFTVKCRK